MASNDYSERRFDTYLRAEYIAVLGQRDVTLLQLLLLLLSSPQ